MVYVLLIRGLCFGQYFILVDFIIRSLPLGYDKRQASYVITGLAQIFT